MLSIATQNIPITQQIQRQRTIVSNARPTRSHRVSIRRILPQTNSGTIAHTRPSNGPSHRTPTIRNSPNNGPRRGAKRSHR